MKLQVDYVCVCVCLCVCIYIICVHIVIETEGEDFQSTLISQAKRRKRKKGGKN